MDTQYTQSHASNFNFSSSGRCLPCENMDSIYHVLLGCTFLTMSGVHTNRHHTTLGLCVEALSKG